VQSFKLSGLKLRKAAGVGAAGRDGDVCVQVANDGYEDGLGQRLARVETVGDIQMAGSARVADEGGRAAGHVRAEYGGGSTQADRPPRRAMTGDVRFVGTLPASPFEETLDQPAIGLAQRCEVGREVNHATQPLGRCEHLGRRD